MYIYIYIHIYIYKVGMPLGGKRLKQDGPSLIGPSGKPVVKVYIFISTRVQFVF